MAAQLRFVLFHPCIGLLGLQLRLCVRQYPREAAREPVFSGAGCPPGQAATQLVSALTAAWLQRGSPPPKAVDGAQRLDS